MENDSSILFNPTAPNRSNINAKTDEVKFCPGLAMTYFETLDSSAPYLVNAALNLSLVIITSFTNVLVLVAMRHVTSIRLPSKLLLCSLVVTDLGTGLASEPQFAALLFIEAIYPGLMQCAMTTSFHFTGALFSCASLLTLTAISLDRYAALFFYLKYQQTVTTRRVCVVVAFVWSFSMFVASMSLHNRELSWGLVAAFCGINVSVMSVTCIKIFRRLRAQQVQPQAPDQAQQEAGNTLNMERYRRTASAMILVYVLFLVCYVPFFCWSLVVAAIGESTLTLCCGEFAYTLLLLNSFLNPFVYCLRLPEIRTEVLKELQKLCCRSSLQ